MMKLFNIKSNKANRLKLRKNQTKAEKLIWSKLRNKQLGFKFNRQYGIGSYIADFYSPKLKLVIEIDGGQHFTEEGKIYDSIREQFMKEAGIKTIRFTNLEVMYNLDGVMDEILRVCEVLNSP